MFLMTCFERARLQPRRGRNDDRPVAEDLYIEGRKCQDTTSVVPNTHQKTTRALAPEGIANRATRFDQ